MKYILVFVTMFLQIYTCKNDSIGNDEKIEEKSNDLYFFGVANRFDYTYADDKFCKFEDGYYKTNILGYDMGLIDSYDLYIGINNDISDKEMYHNFKRCLKVLYTIDKSYNHDVYSIPVFACRNVDISELCDMFYEGRGLKRIKNMVQRIIRIRVMFFKYD